MFSIICPPEITTEILGHLSPKDLLKCRQICTAWRDLIDDHVSSLSRKIEEFKETWLQKNIGLFSEGLSVPIKRSEVFFMAGYKNYDPAIERPEKFIGPLKCNILPNSPTRKLVWIAGLHFYGLYGRSKRSQNEYGSFISRMPDVEVVRKIDDSEVYIYFSQNRVGKKDSFDEAFKNDNYYLSACGKEEAYARMRLSAFQTPNPAGLLNKMGYKEVKKGSTGDLVVYFSNSGRERVCLHPDESRPSHFARVVDVKGNTMVIESRFNYFRKIMRHNLDCIPLELGTSYLIYSKIEDPQ